VPAAPGTAPSYGRRRASHRQAPVRARQADRRRDHPYQQGRFCRGDLGGGTQPFPAVIVLRPDQGLQPCSVLRIGDVEGVQVQPGPPYHLGKPPRRAEPLSIAVDDRPALAHDVGAVPVAVTVRVQTQSRGGAHLQQPQRLRQRGQHRHEQRAAPRLVRLGRSRAQLRLDHRPPSHDEVPEFDRVVHGSAEQPYDGEEQVRLAPGGGVEQSEDLRIPAHGPAEALVRRRDPMRLTLGEVEVDLGDRHGVIIQSSAPVQWCDTHDAPVLSRICLLWMVTATSERPTLAAHGRSATRVSRRGDPSGPRVPASYPDPRHVR
jgi:hypothetical protein